MRSLRDLGSERLTAIWNASAGPKYRTDTSIVDRNLFAHPLFHETASMTDGKTFVAVKRSAATLYQGPDAKVAHLSLCGPESGPLLVLAAEILEKEGFETICVGQDTDHLLHGAPTDISWMGKLLRSLGFTPGSLAFDLERDLLDFRPEASRYAEEFRLCRSEDVQALLSFLTREFPGRWHYDVQRKIRAEGAPTVFALFVQGSCEGFALLQSEGCTLPIGGAIWGSDLGPGWASLGPIGVSKNLRGDGVGTRLLHAALNELSSRGSRRTIIDWTELVDFYGTQEFSINRAYRSYHLNLQADRQAST